MDSYLEKLRQELEETISAAGVERMAAGPSGKWTAAQVLEHLYLTYHHTNNGIAKCLEKGAPLGSPIKFMDRVRTFAVVNVGYFPTGRKSPERAVPKGLPSEEVRRGIVPEIQKMDAGFEECERKFGARAKILDHPVLGPLTAAQWRRFHLAHGKHHARQIRERVGAA